MERIRGAENYAEAVYAEGLKLPAVKALKGNPQDRKPKPQKLRPQTPSGGRPSPVGEELDLANMSLEEIISHPKVTPEMLQEWARVNSVTEPQ